MGIMGLFNSDKGESEETAAESLPEVGEDIVIDRWNSGALDWGDDEKIDWVIDDLIENAEFIFTDVELEAALKPFAEMGEQYAVEGSNNKDRYVQIPVEWLADAYRTYHSIPRSG